MRRMFILGLLAAAVVLLPSVAVAGGTGACYALEGGPTLPQTPLGDEGLQAFCLDGLTEEQCEEIFLSKGGGTWELGLTCLDLDVPWDGSCLFDFGGTVGLDCIWLYDEEPGYTELLCEKENTGVFFDDPAACGVPTPTMPGFGMAALVLLMLAGALVVLTMKGSVKTT